MPRTTTTILSICLVFLFCTSYAQDDIHIIPDQDTLSLCAGRSVTLSASAGESVNWSPEALFDDPSAITVTCTPLSSGYVYLEGFIGDEAFRDSIYLEVVTGSAAIVYTGADNLCEGTLISVSANVSPAGGTLRWIAAGSDIVAPGSLQTDLTAPRNGRVILSYELGGCTLLDTLLLNVSEFGVPQIASDTTVCQGSPVRLGSATGSATTLYRWEPAEGLSAVNVPNPVATPEDTTTYTLYISSLDEQCKDTFSVTISVIPIFARISPPADTILLCKGDSIELTVSVSGDPSTLIWGPDDGVLSSLTGTTVLAKPDYSNFYYVRYQANGCTVYDTVFLKVDSLPLMQPIVAIPAKDEYCPGELITLFSPTYDGLYFPDIEHEWRPQDGSLQSDPYLYNLVIETTVTNWYVRTTTNGGCLIRDSIEIIVKQPSIELNVVDTIVCPGESVQLRILNDVKDIFWMPPQGLSCTDCASPVATVNNTTQYTVSGENQGCPTSANVLIRTFPIPNFFIEVEPEGELYIGDLVKLNAIAIPELGEGVVYTWRINDNPFPGSGSSISNVPLSQRTTVAEVSYVTSDGCRVTTTLVITASEPTYDIPNAFSPNGDGVNDRFRIITQGNLQVSDFRIFSRWGQLLFESKDNEGWDGTFGGKACPPEVYVYVVLFTLPTGATIQERGDLTLLR